jgi:hypothetical protein
MLRWTVKALKKVIAMLRNPEIDSKEVDPDLNKRLENVLGRVPLIPLFLAGNSTPTIPHKFSKHKGSAFPMGSADTANAVAATCMRSTIGSGCLGAASPVWVVSQ